MIFKFWRAVLSSLEGILSRLMIAHQQKSLRLMSNDQNPPRVITPPAFQDSSGKFKRRKWSDGVLGNWSLAIRRRWPGINASLHRSRTPAFQLFQSNAFLFTA
jgi:hypothetical protein